MNRLACLLGAMTVALTGCAAVGPDYKLPAEAMVNDSRANGDFVDADSPALDRSHAARDDWWKLYNDPVLDDLVKQALQANIALRVADANLRRAYTALDIAKDEGGFSSEASASVSRTEISAESLLHTEKLPVYNLAVGGVQAAYEFDLFGKIRRGAEAASADAEVTKAARDLVRITVAARVTESYIGICEASHDIEVARHTVAIQEGAANVAQRMFGAGLGNKLDVTRAATQVDLAKAALPPLLKRREASEYALAALLGHTPGDIPSHAKSCDRALRWTGRFPSAMAWHCCGAGRTFALPSAVLLAPRRVSVWRWRICIRRSPSAATWERTACSTITTRRRRITGRLAR